MGYAEFLRMVIALLFVLALILSGLYIAKRFGKGWGLQHIPLNKRRLKIVESISLGPKQRLLIIKRDDTEHLVIIGNDNSTIVEKDLQSTSLDDNEIIKA